MVVVFVMVRLLEACAWLGNLPMVSGLDAPGLALPMPLSRCCPRVQAWQQRKRFELKTSTVPPVPVMPRVLPVAEISTLALQGLTQKVLLSSSFLWLQQLELPASMKSHQNTRRKLPRGFLFEVHTLAPVEMATIGLELASGSCED